MAHYKDSSWWRDEFDRVPVGVPPFSVGEWDRALGSHRAVVRVDAPAPAVCAYLPWRRRDRHPESKHVMVTAAATGQSVPNSLVVTCNREYGEVVFEPVSGPGLYHLYYLIPMDDANADQWPRWAFPITRYKPPLHTASEAWLQAHGLTPAQTRSLPPNEQQWDPDLVPDEALGIARASGKGRVYAPSWRSLPLAPLVEFQARSAWESAFPMELVATQDERLALERRCRERPFILFHESRRHPIRMTDALPCHWALRGPDSLDRFQDEACRNEYFVFQVGVYASQETLVELRASVSDLTGPDGAVIPAAAATCFNLGGVDQAGEGFRKTVHVASGKVQALWFGLDIPESARPGRYEGVVRVAAAGKPEQALALSLAVTDAVLPDRGDGEAWRLSRLRWLNSRLSLDAEPCAPYTPVEVDGRTVRILGRTLELGADGLPAGLTSFIDMFDIRDRGRSILAAPARLTGVLPDGRAAWTAGGCACEESVPGRAVFVSRAATPELAATHTTTVEMDGAIAHRVVLEARRPLRLAALRLELELPADVARYAVGVGDKPLGGACPDRFSTPAGKVSQFWIGDYNAGLGLRLPPGDNGWANHGPGAVRGVRDERVLRLTLESGPVTLAAGATATFAFELYATPFKPLPRAHWDWRYYHAQYCTLLDIPAGVRAGARIFTQHHETPSNPFISYPFLTADVLRPMAEQIHAAGGSFKVYYTLRELSVRAPELWALRSLGAEILVPAVGRLGYEELSELPLEYQLRDPYSHPFTGMPWLCEHLVSDYHTRWHSSNKSAALEDGSLQISGASRWSNFFIEGVRWLMENIGFDGLYFDGITFDRESLRRVRKTLVRGKPFGLIDYHGSPDVFHLLPFYDSLWFGEGANYGREPEYWLAAVSGIAFGVPGELLLPNASVARGMVYGLCQRYGWMPLKDVNPTGLWAWWDQFDIAAARMVGYWQPDCPVRTDHPQVKATAYVHHGRRLAIALASWAPTPVTVKVEVDWAAVGLPARRLFARAPEIPMFQPGLDHVELDALPVEPDRGWIVEVQPAP